MLNALLTLSEKYSFSVSEFSGGVHSGGSKHYGGTGVDINKINGIPVNSKNPYWKDFVNDAKKLGVTWSAGPGYPYHGTHVHLQF